MTTRRTDRGAGPPAPRRRSAGAGTWLVIAAALLCPASKVITLMAVGGVFGGLLGMPWLLATIGIATAGGGWVLVRTLRRRGARCGPSANPREPEAST